MLLTFNFMELGVQSKTDLSRIHAGQFVFVALRTAQLAEQLPQRNVFLRNANRGEVRGDELMDGEDVRKFDIQSRLLSAVEIIELVDIKLSFSWTNGDD